MAKYTVTHKCGHEETVQLFGHHKDRQKRLEDMQSKDCLQCQNEKAGKENAEAGLPGLEGSEKQIAWAEKIRAQAEKPNFERLMNHLRLLAEEYGIDTETMNQSGIDRQQLDEMVDEAWNRITANVKAAWWIENRNSLDLAVAQEMMQILKNVLNDGCIREQTDTEDSQLEAEAKAEATLQPAEKQTSTICEIRIVDQTIILELPEKREDFRELVRYRHLFGWTGKHWERKITSSYNTTPADKAVEISTAILAHGIPVRLYDENLRQRVIEGDVHAENTKRCVKLKSGKFGLRWQRHDGDYYAAAKKLPGARYEKPFIAVPPEGYEEVLDFVNEHGFWLSPGARELADRMSHAAEKAVTVDAEEPQPEDQSVKRDFSEREFDIDDELRDDN